MLCSAVLPRDPHPGAPSPSPSPSLAGCHAPCNLDGQRGHIGPVTATRWMSPHHTSPLPSARSRCCGIVGYTGLLSIPAKHQLMSALTMPFLLFHFHRIYLRVSARQGCVAPWHCAFKCSDSRKRLGVSHSAGMWEFSHYSTLKAF